MIQPATRQLITEIRLLGYGLSIQLNNDCTTTIIAKNPVTGEEHFSTSTDDGYEAAFRLAAMVKWEPVHFAL